MRAQTVEVETPDGPMPLYEARPAEPRAAVVVVQEAFGVNEHIEGVARRFAEAGYHAVAPHLFHRSGHVIVDYGDVTKAVEMIQTLEDGTILADVDAALGHLHEAGWREGQIGIVGFCMGGRVTFLTAVRRAIGAGVGFYGGGIVTSRIPGRFASLVDEAPALKTPWLGLFGDRDQGIPVEDVERLRAALGGVSVAHEVVRYPDAEHGFFCDQRASYHPESAADAWRRTLAWFESHLEKGRP